MFQVTRTCGGKRSNQSSSGGELMRQAASGISIHPGASAVVCRHTLEVLISLAKSFPTHFLPWKESNSSSSAGIVATNDFGASDTSTPKPKSAQSQCKKDGANDFWETLLRLDQQSRYLNWNIECCDIRILQQTTEIRTEGHLDFKIGHSNRPKSRHFENRMLAQCPKPG